MLKKVQIRSNEMDIQRKLIVDTILSIYPYGGVMQKNYVDDEVRYVFLIDSRNINLMRHDLENLKICGFHAEEMRAL